MGDYIIGFIFVIALSLLFYSIGAVSTNKNKSDGYKLMIGYLIYSFFIGAFGMIVQLFNIPWKIYLYIVILTLIGTTLYVVYQIKFRKKKIFDNGRHWLIDKRNSEGEAFGWVDFYDAMAKSDNVYFYEMGRRVGIDRLAAMSRDFGLGQLTGIDLTGEVEGNVASEEYKKKIFGQDWYLGETFDAAIGQSFTLTTPLQMAMVYSALANGGFKYQPYLVSRVDHLDGTPKKIFSPKRIGSLPLSKATMDVVCEALRRVMQKGGTGGNLFENYPISIAGKSGTAETNGLDNGWFIAYGPFEKPEIVIACMFEHAGFGADSAAPVVKKVMDAYFHFGEYAFAKDRSGAVLRKKGN